jgi:hypothetical protein
MANILVYALELGEGRPEGGRAHQSPSHLKEGLI